MTAGSEIVHLAGEGGVFAQTRINEDVEYLGCSGMNEFAHPEGDTTLIYCKDPIVPNKFNVVGSYKGAPGPVTTTIETPHKAVANWLQLVTGEFLLHGNKSTLQPQNNFDNYDTGVTLVNVSINNRTGSNFIARDPDAQAESMISFELSAERAIYWWRLMFERQSIVETEGLLTVTMIDPVDADPKTINDILTTGYTGGTESGAAAGDIYATTNQGDDWSAASGNPFGTDESITAMRAFRTGRNTIRLIAFRATDVGNPMECAISDDGGANWTNVEIGSTNGQYVVGHEAVHVHDQYNMWVATDDGYIYKSEDGGTTWAAQEEAAIHSGQYNSIHFYNQYVGMAVGASDIVALTTDGGENWAAASANTGTTDDLLSVYMVTEDEAWIGVDKSAGSYVLFYTDDQGVSWTGRTIPLDTGGEVTAQDWYDKVTGWLLHTAAGGDSTIMRTRNGGRTWEDWDNTDYANSGLNAIQAMHNNMAIAVGAPQGGTAMIVHAQMDNTP